MTLLVCGLILFYLTHFIPNTGSIRQTITDRFSEQAYILGYTLLSLAGLLMFVMGKGQADFVTLWSPPMWARHINLGLMLLSMLCFTAMFFPTNLKRWVKHPMLAFVFFWGLAHLTYNGDLASVLLFGSLAVFAAIKTWSLSKRKPSASPAPISLSRDMLVLLLAISSYLAVLYLHPFISGGWVLTP